MHGVWQTDAGARSVLTAAMSEVLAEIAPTDAGQPRLKAVVEYELCWPLDAADYLTVCNEHPTPYRSAAADCAEHGELDDDDTFNPPRYVTCAASEHSDYRIVAKHAALLTWVSVRELGDVMQCEKHEIASLSHHLKSAVDNGLLIRAQRPTTVNGYKRLIWVYRVRGGERAE